MRIEFVGRRPLLRQVTPVHRTEDPGHLVLDMRQLTFVSPLELAAVAALAHTVEARHVPTTLHMPNESDVSSYLARMDLRAVLPPGSRIVGSASGQRRMDRSDRLLEVMRVSAETEDELMDRIGRVALAQLDPGFGRRAVQSIGELVDNAVSHGASPIGAFAAAQTYTGRTSKRRGLEFAICDTGIGILEHLRRNPAYRGLEDGRDALAQALLPGVTGTSDKRGNGLADLFNVTDNAGYSILVLRSGAGLASVAARRHDRRRDYVATADEITGTWAWLRVRDP